MWFAVFAAFVALALSLASYGLAARIARRRYFSHARTAARLHDELERRLIKLGAGLGIGA